MKSRQTITGAVLGALVFAATGSLSVTNGQVGVSHARASEVVVTDGQISRLRSALALTAAQQPLWRPVEAALRSYAQAGASYQVASADAGMIARVKAKVSGYALDTMAQARVRSAAGPLIGTLSDQQKTAGLAVLQTMGF